MLILLPVIVRHIGY